MELKNFLLVALFVSFVLAHAERCGTKDETPERKEKIEQIAVNFRTRVCSKNPSLRICNRDQATETGRKRITTIPVAFHIIYDPNSGAGNVSQSVIDAQLSAMNDHFKITEFQFSLYTVTRTGNSQWFYDLNRYEFDAKRALNVGLPNVFQMYFGSLLSGGLLGFCYFPWSYPESDYRHGCVNDWQTMPGPDAYYPYDEGKTVSHEVGHGVGLYHTFQGGCNGAGDMVDDTNRERSAKYGCPNEIDTCGDGPDPINNYMNYVDDRCMWEFTPGQAQRMYEQIAQYKPSLLNKEDREAIQSTDSLVWEEVKNFQSQ